MSVENTKKLALGMLLLLPSSQIYADSVDGFGAGLNFELLGGIGIDLTYAYSDTLQVRAVLSQGLDESETEEGDGNELDYAVEVDGGINRIALDYHPFGNGFYVSGGYAFSDFAVSGNASGQNKQVGDQTFAEQVSVNSGLTWDDGFTVTAGWGHSPDRGFGFNVEFGAIFTGDPGVSTSGEIIGADAATEQAFNDALDEESENFKDDVASIDSDILPIFQIGLNYRF